MKRPLADNLSSRQIERLDALVRAAREAREEGLLVSTSGNVSVRLDGDHVAISAARSRLGKLDRSDLLIVRALDGAVEGALGGSEGDRRPSRETPMHLAILRARPDVGSVLHFQSLAGTIFACRAGPTPDLNFIPEFPVYIRRVADVPFLPPGSDVLATQVADAFRDTDVRLVQLAGHGQVVVGDGPEQAVERGVFFELACRMALLAGDAGALRAYSEEDLTLLRTYG